MSKPCGSVILQRLVAIQCVCFALVACSEPGSSPGDTSDDLPEDTFTQGNGTNSSDSVATSTQEEDTGTPTGDDDTTTATMSGAVDDTADTQTESTTDHVNRHVMVGVLKVNLLDENVGCSDEQIEQTLGEIVECFFESSFGQFLITAEIIGEVTIDKDASEPCSNAAFSALADEQGIDWSPYEKRIYLFPRYTCGFSATAQGGGAKIWSTVCDWSQVLVHELGHTFGLQHSALVEFKQDPTNANKYGDTSCNMGYASTHRLHFNGPHKVQMDWIAPESVLEVDSPGTYILHNLETSTTQTQVIQIAIPDTQDHYYLSYRTKLGLDVNLHDNYAMKTSVHIWDGSGLTFLSAALDDEESYVDANLGLILTQSSHDNAAARIEIEFQD